MEFKVIVYIVVGVLYWIYKNRENKSEENAPKTTTGKTPPKGRTIEDILNEARKQFEQATAPPPIAEKPKQRIPEAVKPKRKPAQRMLSPEEEGVTDYVPEALKTDPFSVEGAISDTEGTHSIKSILEIMKEEDAERVGFEVDLRNAVIYQAIMEKKFD